jgi:hypothetical protein
MSAAKFASLSAGLLVRKGEAAPSAIAAESARPSGSAPDRVAASAFMHPREPVHAPAWADGVERAPAPEWQELPPRIVAPEQTFSQPVREIALHSDHPDKPRRLMVSLSPDEYEMLGLIGVKKHATRHQLLRVAFDEYLLQLVEEFGEGCYCIANGGSCDTKC